MSMIYPVKHHSLLFVHRSASIEYTRKELYPPNCPLFIGVSLFSLFSLFHCNDLDVEGKREKHCRIASFDEDRSILSFTCCTLNIHSPRPIHIRLSSLSLSHSLCAFNRFSRYVHFHFTFSSSCRNHRLAIVI